VSKEELKFEYSPAQYRTILEKVENDRVSNFLRTRVHRLIRHMLKKRNDFTVVNQEILSKQTSFVLVGNHSSHLDILCLFSALPLERVNTCYSVAAADYFFSNDIFAYFSRIVANTLPFSRDYVAYAGLKACGNLLSQGKSLMIFPEGTRSRTGEMQAFKSGIGILMAGRREPVIPAYIHGAFNALPRGKMLPKRSPIRVVIGEPMYFDKYESMEDNWHVIAGKIEDKVKELKGTVGK